MPPSRRIPFWRTRKGLIIIGVVFIAVVVAAVVGGVVGGRKKKSDPNLNPTGSQNQAPNETQQSGETASGNGNGNGSNGATPSSGVPGLDQVGQAVPSQSASNPNPPAQQPAPQPQNGASNAQPTVFANLLEG